MCYVQCIERVQFSPSQRRFLEIPLDSKYEALEQKKKKTQADFSPFLSLSFDQ